MAPDLDGLTFLSGLSGYWSFHHTFGHSLFIIPFIAVGLGLFGHKKILTILFCWVGSLAHVAVDIFGSWPVHLLWPVYPDWALIDTPNAFIIFPVEFITPFVMIAWSIRVYKKRGITIFEIFGGWIESQLYAWLKKISA